MQGTLQTFATSNALQPKFSIRRVLWISLSGIGDTIVQLPALEALRIACPDAQITALVRLRGSRDILESHAAVDEVIAHPFDGYWSVLRLAASLQRRRFDVTALGYPSNRASYNLLSWLLRGRMRLTTRYLHQDRRCLGFLNRPSRRTQEHLSRYVADHNVALLEPLGITPTSPAIPRLPLSITDRGAALALLCRLNISPAEPLIALHAGCSTFKNHGKRRWPAAKFIELGRRLGSSRILVMGGAGPGELRLNQEIVRGIGRNAVLCQTSSFREACAVLERCQIFVGNDGSLFHASYAVGTPTVGIFGPTNVDQVAPKVPHVRVVRQGLPCSPCFDYSPKPLTCTLPPGRQYACVRELSVEAVWKAMEPWLRQPCPPRAIPASS